MTDIPTGTHVTLSFGSWLMGTASAGKPWHAPDGNVHDYDAYIVPTGMVVVDDGRGAVWFYKVGRSDARAFRVWAEAVFLGGDRDYRLAGRFPSYGVVAR